jgi:type III secretory pathway lipoprotein EscJ
VALSIEDSIGTVSGVLEARVHLNLPETDPLFGTRKESIGSGSVLLIVDTQYGSKDEEIAALVAGAAGIPAAKVTVLKSQARSNPSDVVSVQAEVMPAHDAASAPLAGLQGSPTGQTILTADVGLASLAFVALVGTGAVLFTRRRKKVKFILPSGDDEGDV